MTLSKNTAELLKDFQLSTDPLETLENPFRNAFEVSPQVAAVQSRLESLTERLQSIALSDRPFGRQLTREIQSTMDSFTTNSQPFTDVSIPRFSSRIGRRSGSRKSMKLEPETRHFHDHCEDHAHDDHDKADFNTVGGNDNFGQNYGKWSQPGGKDTAVDVTYSFKKDFDAPGLSLNKAKSLFREALQSWADYAPLNFREIADPGNGDLVDIQVGDKFIDGSYGTLAFAYYPKGGDITFDNGENWRESLYLETAVHEIGHALGLGHENGTSAIMNSSIKNRFSDNAFLLQDDINGIQTIYGSGKGSVRSLGQAPTQAPKPTPDPAPTPDPTPAPKRNLVANGSFEISAVGNNQFGVFNQIQGWKTFDGSGIQVERRDQFGAAADGDAWVELDSYSNSTMYQQVDTLLGEDYRLSFEYSARQGLSAETNQVRVYWGDRWIDTITRAGSSNNQWKTFAYDVKGTADKSLLAFRAVGMNDQVGGFIDDVVVTQGSAAQAATAGEAFASDRSEHPLFAAADTTFTGATCVL